jgi:iron complex outermembrane recepter protein
MFKIFIVSVLSIISLSLNAQKSASGKVFDSLTKEPIVGATVSNLAKSEGTTTDINGSFTLKTNDEKVLISFIGFEPLEMEAAEKMAISLTPSVQNLQNVIVTANREASLRTTAPIAISKVSAQLIDEAKPTSAYEVVNKAAGVLMVNLNNEQHSMSIRQPMTTNAYFLYMEDGIPIRPLGVFNHNSLLEMNQFTVSSIEVVKGPVSSIYGAEAVGGAINFISQRPTAIPTARIGVQFDQWGYKRLQYGGGATMGKFGFYVGGLVSQQRDSWFTSSDYDKNAQYARLEYNFSSKTRLTGTLSYANYNSQTSGSVDSIAFYTRQYVSTTGFTYRKSYSLRTRLTLEHSWNDKAQTFITAFGRDNKHGQNPAYAIRWTSGAATATGQINSNDFQSLGLIAQHSQKFDFLKSKLIVGAVVDFSPNKYNAYRTDLAAELRADKKSVIKYTPVKERPDIQLANYNADIHNTAAYVQYDINPLPSLRLSFGGRYDNMAFDYTNYLDTTEGGKNYAKFSPKLGLTYEIAPNVGVYANYSKGFSPPALTAIFVKRLVPTPTGELFYYNLQPALFDNTEIGGWASLWKNKIYFDFAVYQMNGTNELLNIRQPDNSTDYQSAGKTLHKGIELGVSFKPTQEVFFRFGGTRAVHRFVEFTLSQRATDVIKNVNGFDMPSSPQYIFNTELSYYPKWFKNFRTSVEWQKVGKWYQNQINTVSYDGYSVINARVGYKWKGIEIYTNVLNATDALYAYNATRGNNATDRTTFTAAAPRTFIMGLQYSFAGKSK